MIFIRKVIILELKIFNEIPIQVCAIEFRLFINNLLNVPNS